jgi:hypothetical protein
MSAPTITSALVSTATAGSAFSYTITADNSPTSYAASNLPSNVTLDTATGIISGTPLMGIAYSIGLSATNGDGTGTATLALTVASPANAGSTWRAARLREFNALVATSQFGTTFSYRGVSYPCIAPPFDIALLMQPANYMQEIPGEFCMYATEDDLPTYNFAASGLTQKSVIQMTLANQVYSFEIYSISIDPKEPTVRFRANRKQ